MAPKKFTLPYVLKVDSEELDLLKELDCLLEGIGGALNKEFCYVGSKHEGYGIDMHFWKDLEDGKTWIRLVCDKQMPATYLSIEGDEIQDCGRIGDLLGKTLPFVSIAELRTGARDAIRNTRDPGALTRLGLGIQDTSDIESASILEAGLMSKDVELRIAAAVGINSLRWPRFIEPLRAALQDEHDEGAKRVFSAVLRSVQETAENSATRGGVQ